MKCFITDLQLRNYRQTNNPTQKRTLNELDIISISLLVSSQHFLILKHPSHSIDFALSDTDEGNSKEKALHVKCYFQLTKI